MTAIIRHAFRFKNMREALKKHAAEKDFFYLAVGRAKPWTNESLPPEPDVDPKQALDARHSIWAAKKIVNAIPCAPRYNWVNGNTYVGYDSTDPELHTKAYYVLNTTNFNVYMCLKAGPGASTVEPIGIDDDDGAGGIEGEAGSSPPALKGDGYIWKFMYNIDSPSANRYLTTNYMPVLRNVDVAANAIRGAIHRLKIVTAGVGYAGTPTVAIQGDGTGATATVTVSSGQITGITMTNIGSGYTYARAVLSGGSPSTPGSLTPIIAPQSDGRELAGIQVVGGGTSYANGAMDLVIEGDGYDAEVTATVSGGVIQASPTIDVAGWGYTQATVRPATTTAGTAATLKPKWSGPKGGFGYDPVVEMNAFYTMFNITLDGAEGSGDFVPANDYRQLMILQNPLDFQADPQAFTDTTGIGLKHHVVDAGGTWVIDDLITGSSSGAKAYIVYYDADNEKLYYYQNDETGYTAFSNADNLTGVGVSTGSIASTANVNGEFDRYSGAMLYLENRPPVSRAVDQLEDIKLTVQW